MIIRSSHTTNPPGTTSDKFARCQWQVLQQEQTTNTWVIKKHGCSGGIMPNSYRCLSHLGDARCIPFQWACRWISWYRKFWGWIGRRFGIGFPWSGRRVSISCALSWFAQSHSITHESEISTRVPRRGGYYLYKHPSVFFNSFVGFIRLLLLLRLNPLIQINPQLLTLILQIQRKTLPRHRSRHTPPRLHQQYPRLYKHPQCSIQWFFIQIRNRL